MRTISNFGADAIGRDEFRPQELARLIRKLRWARLEHEAQELESLMSEFPAEHRGSVSAGPFSTD